jgi:hypothetical protein
MAVRVILSAWQTIKNQAKIRRRWRWGGWVECGECQRGLTGICLKSRGGGIEIISFYFALTP